MDAIHDWLTLHPLSPIEVDCTTTVMLKILDGKCKMTQEDKIAIAALYQAIKHLPGQILSTQLHQSISKAMVEINEAIKMQLYENRLLAETMISRPVMKQFKARIRQDGLYDIHLAPALPV